MAAGAWGVIVSFIVMYVLASMWKEDTKKAQAIRDAKLAKK